MIIRKSAVAKRLKSNEGLSVEGYVSGFSADIQEGTDRITIEVGKKYTKGSQQFSVNIPQGIGIDLISTDVIIIIVPKET